MISWLIAWFTSNSFLTITRELQDAYERRLAARNDTDRLNAEMHIAVLQARHTVLLQEQNRALTSWIRPAFAFPFVIYDIKIVLFDKVLEWGRTDDLSPDFWRLQMIIFGAYFLTRPLERYR